MHPTELQSLWVTLFMRPCSGEHTEPIKTLITDVTRMGCDIYAEALGRQSQCFQIVSCGTTIAEVLDAARNTEVDVALISVGLADGPLAGVASIAKLKEIAPGVRCLLLIDSPEQEIIVSAFRAGARGIVPRTGSLDGLRKAIHVVQKGEIWASQRDLHFLLEALNSSPTFSITNARGESLLTKREQELVALVASGLTNREISTRMTLSEHTVKNYLFRIFEKLGVSNRVELILYAMASQNNKDVAA
jgi:DNA-binding NarL/FixJ family response regulator